MQIKSRLFQFRIKLSIGNKSKKLKSFKDYTPLRGEIIRPSCRETRVLNNIVFLRTDWPLLNKKLADIVKILLKLVYRLKVRVCEQCGLRFSFQYCSPFPVFRVTFAAARDGNFPEVLSYLNVRSLIPTVSVVLTVCDDITIYIFARQGSIQYHSHLFRVNVFKCHQIQFKKLNISCRHFSMLFEDLVPLFSILSSHIANCRVRGCPFSANAAHGGPG